MQRLTLEIDGASRPKGPVNEDASLIDEPHRLFGVFDGLGATSQAAEAARLAADIVEAAYRDHPADGDCDAERAFLVEAVQLASARIASDLHDGLTTASVVRLCERADGGVTALVANVGDSRVYRYAADGTLHQCTLDDSVFGADWDLQLRLSEVVVPTRAVEHLYFEQRHVLDRCLGDRAGPPRCREIEVDDGDWLLAVTDGVTDNLTFSEIRELLAAGPGSASELARRLVDRAYARSQDVSHARAKVDDITAAVARVRIADR